MQKIPSLSEYACISLIGMPGSGKSAVGARLAEMLGWAHVDTDFLIEAAYGTCLQAITDACGREMFLEIEAQIVQAMRVQRAVISTGGSVIYNEATMQYLQELGAIVYLDAPLDLLVARIAEKPDRGIAIAPGQSFAELFAERKTLYEKWAVVVLPVQGKSVDLCAEAILNLLNKG